MSLIELRPYQRDAVDAVTKAWEGGMRRPGISLPTGAGKTIVLSQIVKESGQRSIVIAHRKEIVEQNADKAHMVIDDADIGIVMGNTNQYRAGIISASVQTLANPYRLEQVGEFGLVVADECHHASSPSWTYVLDRLGAGKDGNVRLLGCSATWDRSDGHTLEHAFDDIVYQLQMEFLITQGFLTDILPFAISVDLDTSQVRRSRHGDFNQDDLADAINNRSTMPGAIAHALATHGQGRHSLVFAPRVDTAFAYAEAIQATGLRTEVVTGTTLRLERESLIADFKRGIIDVLCNVGVFTEGTDIPVVDLIAMGRPTQSRSLFQQMVGRGLRPHLNKQNCILLDFVQATSQHALQTIATVFGPYKQGQSVRQSISENQEAEYERSVQGPMDLELVPTSARAVTLMGFDRSLMEWIQIEDNAFTLSAGDTQYLIRPDKRNSDHFEVLAIGPDGRRELARGLDMGYAQGIVEHDVQKSRTLILAQRNAPWRARTKQEPATKPQLGKLWYLGVKVNKPLTKDEASKMISEAIARQNLAS